MGTDLDHKGGCLCGAVRYRVTSAPFDSGYCHCRMCQKAAGAPVLAFATVPLADFEVTAGTPRRRRSSDIAERWFCGDCGSQIAMRMDASPQLIELTVASLDEPGAAPPGFHIWTESRVAWFDLNDGLPSFERSRPDEPSAG